MILYRAIAIQTESVRSLQSHSVLTRIAEGSKDADMVLKTIRNINNLCNIFQVSLSKGCQEELCF